MNDRTKNLGKTIFRGIIFCLLLSMAVWLIRDFFPNLNPKSMVKVIKGDTVYREKIISDPRLVGEIRPTAPAIHPEPPVIIYKRDTSGRVSVDTNAIKTRYESIIRMKDSLISELLTIRIYRDTVNDSSAQVSAVINDRVQNNRLQAGREVQFKNYRPKIEITPPVIERKFHYGINAFAGTDLLDKTPMAKVGGEAFIGFKVMRASLEPGITVSAHPTMGLDFKIGIGIWGK